MSRTATRSAMAPLCATDRSKWWTRPLNVAGHGTSHLGHGARCDPRNARLDSRRQRNPVVCERNGRIRSGMEVHDGGGRWPASERRAQALLSAHEAALADEWTAPSTTGLLCRLTALPRSLRV